MIGYGGDYNPEQWPAEIWDEDLRLMREAGVNLVTVGVFSWSSLQPTPHRYEWGWLDRALDRLHAEGIRVILATPTASPPPWFSRAHPDALPVTADGARLWHGSRDTYCVHAPAYQQASAEIVGALAQRYATHPAVVMWHVHNEYGTDCHCDYADAAFRDWLRARYGALDALNEAWTTSFWSQGYADWDDITTPRATRYLPNPTQGLDFRRFLSAALKAHYTAQRDVFRAASPGTPVTTNFAFGNWVPVDVWDWAGDLDLAAIDCYPTATGVVGAQQVAFAADLARGIGDRTTGRSWLVMEQAADLVYSRGRMLPRPAGELTRHSLAHLARGATGILHFQWRGAPGGAELWHAAMLPHAGAQTPGFREVCALGETLTRLADLDEPVPARVALVWDPQAWWGLSSPGLPADDLDYYDGVLRVHAALGRLAVPVDVVPPHADLSGYQVVLVPHLYCVSDAEVANLAGFAGALVVWYLSALVDERLRVRAGGHPGAFAGRLGIRLEQFGPLPADTRQLLSSGAVVDHWRETVVPRGATVIDKYPDGSPAVTRNGAAWYVSTRLDPDALSALLARVLAAAGVADRPVPAPPGVEVTRRGGWTFVLNHTDEPATVEVSGRDVPAGEQVDEPLLLPPGGYAVLRG